MKLTINKLILNNFKGVKHNELVFGGKSVKILGQNATSKTTTADAMYWLFSDSNYALIKNPPVTPLGMEECISRVEAELEIDGKPLSIAKNQKYKSKDVDGKITSAITNTYEINSVEKAYKDFVADLTERGIPMDDFLTFSHPAAFTSDNSKQGREKQRALLFKMCEGITDNDIANEINGIEELKELFDIYKLEEIEQMQKSTLKKIKESVGLDNSIINARIEEVLSQKSKIDEKVLEEQKKQYEAEIERCEKELQDVSKAKADKSKELSKLLTELSEETIKANEKTNAERTEVDAVVRDLERNIQESKFQLENAERELTRTESLLNEAEQDIENHRTIYKKEQNAVIDDDALVCSLCGRPFEEDKISTIKAEFEQNKAKRLATLKSTGEELKAKIEGYKDDIDKVGEKIERLGNLIETSQGMLDVAKEKSEKLSKVATNEKITSLNEEIAKIEAELKQSDDSRKEEIESAKNVARQMLNQVIGELSVVSRNKELDKRVEELREERKNAEIKRANAEKILNEVDIFKKAKNDRLSEEINKHFKVAQFRLFKQLKNGNIEDACDVLIDGKEINTQVNQASQVLAKLDIIRGLSDYFETWLPVFVDDFSLFTSQSEEQIKMDNQLIKLVARDGIQEIEVSNG